jgi:hypothetical protein
MDIGALKAKFEKLNPAKDPNRAMWFKANEKDTTIRMLPYPHAKDPFIEVYFHYNIGNERSLVCPDAMLGKPCPICEAADKFRNMGGDDNWQIAKSLFPKLRTYSPIIIKDDEEPVVKLWGYSKTIYNILLEHMMDPDWGDFTDEATGRDLVVKTSPPGKNGNNTNFHKPEAKLKPATSKLSAKHADLIDSIPDYLHEDSGLFKVKSYDELMTALNSMAEPSAESTDTSTGTSVGAKAEQSDKPTDIQQQLDNIFG